MLQVGDKIETWFSGSDDGLSTILAIEPYRGKFKTWFSHTVRVTAPRTQRGWVELSLSDDAMANNSPLRRLQQPSMRERVRLLCDPAYTPE